jgi:hypothetical protein
MMPEPPTGYELTITEEGVFERVYHDGEEPFLRPIVPFVATSFDTGQVDVGSGETAVIVVFRESPDRGEEDFVLALDVVTAKMLVVALTGNLGRLVTGPM